MTLVHSHSWRRLRPWKRHSLVVGMGGLVYLAYGIFFTLLPLTADRREALGLAFAFHIPADFWGAVWVGVGCLALASTRWPEQSETWGYTCLAGLSALWASFYALSMAFLNAPLTGIAGSLVWTLVAVMWWGISGLRNPDEIPKER